MGTLTFEAEGSTLGGKVRVEIPVADGAGGDFLGWARATAYGYPVIENEGTPYETERDPSDAEIAERWWQAITTSVSESVARWKLEQARAAVQPPAGPEPGVPVVTFTPESQG